MKTLGEIGYEKWRSLIDPTFKNRSDWDRLPPKNKQRWEDVAQTIVDAHTAQAIQAVWPT